MIRIKETVEKIEISLKTVENQMTNALKFIRTNLNRENITVILFFLYYLFHN